MTAITFFVAGEPAPKGSTKSFPFKGKDGRLRVSTTNANPRTKDWQMRIATEAQRAIVEDGWTFDDDKEIGYDITGAFYFTKPKSAPKKRVLNTREPDLDKIARACLDALTGVLFPDDSQVIHLDMRKTYAPEGHGPGLSIRVTKVRVTPLED